MTAHLDGGSGCELHEVRPADVGVLVLDWLQPGDGHVKACRAGSRGGAAWQVTKTMAASQTSTTPSVNGGIMAQRKNNGLHLRSVTLRKWRKDANRSCRVKMTQAFNARTAGRV